MSRPLLILMIALTALSAYGRRQRTTIPSRRQPAAAATAAASTSAPSLQLDTVTDRIPELLALAGYDKPLTASRETLHATNLSATDTIAAFTLEIAYLDRLGRQLHKRRVTVNQELCPGETLLVGFPTWDQQRSFYYHAGPTPRRVATPYWVNITPLAVILRSHRIPPK